MKKGFTLVELLAVVVILVSVTLVTTIIIVGYVKNTEKTLDEASKLILYNATDIYLNEYLEQLDDGVHEVRIQVLVDTNCLDYSFVENQGEEKIKMNSSVVANVVNGKTTYEFRY